MFDCFEECFAKFSILLSYLASLSSHDLFKDLSNSVGWHTKDGTLSFFYKD